MAPVTANSNVCNGNGAHGDRCRKASTILTLTQPLSIAFGGRENITPHIRSTRYYVGVMGHMISHRELRNDSARVLRAVDERQSFVIIRRGKPVEKLIPLHRNRFVERVFSTSPTIDRESFLRDVDDVISQGIGLRDRHGLRNDVARYGRRH